MKEGSPSVLKTAVHITEYTFAIAVAQLAVEYYRIVSGSDIEKFPNGITDLYPLEELIEGAIPGFVGAMLGALLYENYRMRKGLDYSSKTEERFITYCVLAILVIWICAGHALHILLDVPDVHILPRN